jgi:hypothetical protein
LMGWIFLATVACSTRSTLVPADAASKKDGTAGADGLVLPDAIEVVTGAPDLAPNRDVASLEDTPPAVSPDLAAPDHASDLPSSGDARDATSDGGARDMVVADGSARDVAADLASTDAVSRDVASPDVGAPDGASPDAAGDAIFLSIDGPLAAFCTGDYPRMVVNGIESNPVARGRVLPLSCCAAGEIQVNTATFLHTIVVAWRAEAGPTSTVPATIDLANPPTGWSVRVVVGCESSMSSCNPQPDGYTTGLEGVLQVSRSGSGWDMSLCLHVQEPADSPHPIVHTLDLYVQHVTLD